MRGLNALAAAAALTIGVAGAAIAQGGEGATGEPSPSPGAGDQGKGQGEGGNTGSAQGGPAQGDRAKQGGQAQGQGGQGGSQGSRSGSTAQGQQGQQSQGQGQAPEGSSPSQDQSQASQGGAQGQGGQGGTPAGAVDPSKTELPASGKGGEGRTSTTAERAGGNKSGMEAGTYAVRLRDLEQRINELKEEIFRSKSRLSLLAESVLKGPVGGSQVVIKHENRMSNSYQLVKAVYALDGAPIFNKADESGQLGEQTKFQIYNGSMVPGKHTLTVKLEYRGHGYGVFSYLKGYRFKVRSNYSFSAPEGKALKLRVIGYEKGGPTAPLEERPAVRYIERVQELGTSLQSGGGE